MESADPVLPHLIRLLRGLCVETGGLLDPQDESQIWYNRGYANGRVAAIRELGYGNALPGGLDFDLDPAAPDLIAQ